MLILQISFQVVAATIVAKNPALLGAVGGISGLPTVRQHRGTVAKALHTITVTATRGVWWIFFLHRIPSYTGKLVIYTVYKYTCLVEGQARVNLCLG